MKEQIEEMAKIAEEAIDNQTAHNCPSSPCPYRESSICCDVCHTLEALHNAGYRKQSEGEWKWISDDDVICSACGKVFYTADNADAGLSIWSFCPNCGAKMKGGAE